MSKAYTGDSRRLVIAFDVGTTYSGVSYCLLDPGQEPKICNITRYPGQEHVSGSAKIPTLLCYDLEGQFCAAGAEALLAENVELVEDEEWIKVEWFKIRMRPNYMPSAVQSSTLPPLPVNKTLVQVFADFLEYLMTCAERFIRESHITLSRSWDTLKNSIVFILGHPNGWEGAQQSTMRQAAIIAKLVPDTPQGHSRVKFVTEGEASLQYCLRENAVDNDAKGFVVADLGGGTLDFSAYKVIGTQPLRVEEISPAKCELQGSTFVTARAKAFIKDKLRESRYGSDEHIKQISERFDETTKKIFRDTKDTCIVPFGSIADKDLINGIKSGKLKLTGYVIVNASLLLVPGYSFLVEPSIAASVAAIVDLISESSIPITTVYLVGGFSASPYMTAQLKEHLSRFDISVICPDGQTAKAVADGAVSFYVDQYVSSRIARHSYAIRFSWEYDPSDQEHIKRESRIFTRESGRKFVDGGLNTILCKGTSVSTETEFCLSASLEHTILANLMSTSIAILVYRGAEAPPKWEDQIVDDELLTSLCFVTADTSALMNMLSPKLGINGKYYWILNFRIIIFLGGTELKAQIAWYENGVEKRGPAQIMYGEID